MKTRAERPQLTISLLASDRPDSIRKCLDSLRPIMERIPSELILVDTSKNPQVHEILLEYTDQVYEFEWCNDFSKARNVGLKKAKGEWFLFLDDDEWFVEIDELVDFFQSGEYKNYGYAHYLVRNFYDPSYTYYSDSWVTRMARIDKDTEFRSKIHEYMYPVSGDYKHIYAMAYHSGYIFATEEQKRAHFERNAQLLLKMIEEEPNNLRWKIQMAQEYRSVKELDTLCEFCEKCLDEMKGMNRPTDGIHLGTFYVAYVEALLLKKEYDKAGELCERALRDTRNTKLCQAVIHLALAEIAFRVEQWSIAEKQVETFFQLQEELLQKPEELEEMQRALIVQEAFDDISIKKAYSIRICCDMKLRSSIELLETYYENLGWSEKVIYAFSGIEKVLVWAMATMDYHPIFARIVTDAYGNSELREWMCHAAQEWDGNGEAYKKVMYAYAKADADDWYIWYTRVLVAGMDKDAKSMQESLDGFFVVAPNVFIIPEKIYEMAAACGLNLAQKWENVPADKWIANVREYFAQASKEHIDLIHKRMKDVFEQENWRYRYFEFMLIERQIAKGPKEPWNLASHMDALQMYVNEALAFYGEYYKEEAFISYPEVLPEDAQAAVKIMEFLELEQQDTISGLEALKEAAMLYPELAEGIKRFLAQYPELEKQRARKQKEELHQLRDQVVEQVKDMLKKGQADQALAVIGQLKQMVPDDLEVLALGLEARLASLQ